MRDQHHGHPLGGTLIIAAIFSVALAFYLTTPTARLRSTSVPAALSPLAARIPAHPPAVDPRVAEIRVASRPAKPVAVVQDIARVEATASVTDAVSSPEPALPAMSWPTVAGAYAAPASRVSANGGVHPTGDRGAVTHAFATARSAIRSAFKKAF